jgi:ATP-dependent RNA helicase DDX56/DBP9
MKRKLNQNDVPTSAKPDADQQMADAEAATTTTEPTATTTTTTTTTAPTTGAASDEDKTFADLGLDARLVQAVAQQKFLKPTLVQRRAIPLALDGKDVLCKAKTGSGKTAAYVLPVLAGILKKKSVRFPSFASNHVGSMAGGIMENGC